MVNKNLCETFYETRIRVFRNMFARPIAYRESDHDTKQNKKIN